MKKTANGLKQTVVSLLLAAALLAPAYSMMVLPKPVEAGPRFVVEVGPNVVQNTANAGSNLLNYFTNFSIAQKELFLDGIANAAAKALLRSMVTSIVNWINSGFQGSPAFLTDFKGFMLGVADEAIGNLIYNDPNLNFLCSPFQLDVKIAIAVQYNESRPGSYRPQCTLSDVMDNVEGFFDGAFDQGGWPGMIEMVQNPSNNPTGAFLSVQGEAYIRIVDSQGQEIHELARGNGFFSMEVCDITEFRDGSRPNCVIGTPGSVIANSINKALGAGQDELIAADEINEIFNALFSQLMRQIFEGAFGLLGLGGNDGYSDNRYGFGGDLPYLEAIEEEEASTTLDTDLFEDILPINNSLEEELAYQELLNETIARVDEAEADYLAAADRISCEITFPFPDEIADFRDAADEQLVISELREEALTILSEAFRNATSTDTQLEVLEEYRNLEDEFGVRTRMLNAEYELRIRVDLEQEISNLNTAINQFENQCDDD